MNTSVKIAIATIIIGILSLSGLLFFQKFKTRINPPTAKTHLSNTPQKTPQPVPLSTENPEGKQPLIYTNEEFGFSLNLPGTFDGYKAVTLYTEDGQDFQSCADAAYSCIAEIFILMPTDNSREFFKYWEQSAPMRSNEEKTVDGYRNELRITISSRALYEKSFTLPKCIKDPMDIYCPQRLSQMASGIVKGKDYVYMLNGSRFSAESRIIYQNYPTIHATSQEYFESFFHLNSSQQLTKKLSHTTQTNTPTKTSAQESPVIYTNKELGFSLDLPAEFKDYKVTTYKCTNGFYPCVGKVYILMPTNNPQEFFKDWECPTTESCQQKTINGYKYELLITISTRSFYNEILDAYTSACQNSNKDGDCLRKSDYLSQDILQGEKYVYILGNPNFYLNSLLIYHTYPTIYQTQKDYFQSIFHVLSLQ